MGSCAKCFHEPVYKRFFVPPSSLTNVTENMIKNLGILLQVLNAYVVTITWGQHPPLPGFVFTAKDIGMNDNEALKCPVIERVTMRQLYDECNVMVLFCV